MWQDAGFLTGEADVKFAIKKLAHYIETMPEAFKALTDQELLQFPAPGKWSSKQILGHLIDSAINNLKRFTDIQFLPQPYLVQSYSQNELGGSQYLSAITIGASAAALADTEPANYFCSGKIYRQKNFTTPYIRNTITK